MLIVSFAGSLSNFIMQFEVLSSSQMPVADCLLEELGSVEVKLHLIFDFNLIFLNVNNFARQCSCYRRHISIRSFVVCSNR